ncbi:hypothetical protein Taro_043751, partial [Colocasia esculenta]|nr:hypothetical protein [Colocasia esculenta]
MFQDYRFVNKLPEVQIGQFRGAIAQLRTENPVNTSLQEGEVPGSWEEARGSSELGGGGANLREGPLRLDLHLEVRLHSSSLRSVARRRARNRSVSPSGSPDPWAAVPTVGSLVGAGDPGAGAVI